MYFNAIFIALDRLGADFYKSKDTEAEKASAAAIDSFVVNRIADLKLQLTPDEALIGPDLSGYLNLVNDLPLVLPNVKPQIRAGFVRIPIDCRCDLDLVESLP